MDSLDLGCRHYTSRSVEHQARPVWDALQITAELIKTRAETPEVSLSGCQGSSFEFQNAHKSTHPTVRYT